MHPLAQRVLDHIQRNELLRPGDRVGVAVSAGIDSVGLLRLLLELRHELGVVLFVVHFNHKLRGADSDADEEFVAGLAREHDLEFYRAAGDTARIAAERSASVEAAARELRYEFFWRLLGMEESSFLPEKGCDGAPAAEVHKGNTRLSKIVTAHTLDDQAETVLMRIIRGTGLRGLAGIYPRVVVENEHAEHENRDEIENDDEDHSEEGKGEIVRPLLGVRRGELEQYLTEIDQRWREDASNADSRFTRNRVRKLVLPLLEREFNPSIAHNLSELAEIARDEEDYWENEVSGWMGTVVQWSQPEWTRGLPGFANPQPFVQILSSASEDEHTDAEVLQKIEEAEHAVANATLSRAWLISEPKAVQRRVIKAIGEHAGIPLEFKHIEQILHFAGEIEAAGKELSLPLGWRVVREPESMIFLTPDLRSNELPHDYQYSLRVPGRVQVPELRVVIEALRIASNSEAAEYNPQQLLDAKLLPSTLTVRNWRSGDRFWPARTKSPKKIKELLQDLHVHRPQRALWPVLASGEGIVWVRGFPAPAKFGWKGEGEALMVREVAATPDDEV